MYDYIFITLDSSFYKVNLYNELKKNGLKIFVIFLCLKNKNRSDNFLNYEKYFEYIYLSDKVYEKRNKIRNSFKIFKILKNKEYKKLILGGWDSLENWISMLISPKTKNVLAVESSEIESTSKGLKGLLKKIFILKISYGLVSGEAQKKLLLNLNFKGKIIKTKGVGILNLTQNIKKIERIEKKIRKFIFVGGLISVKNVEQIIKIFNKFPELELRIVGKGNLEKSLKKMARKNIYFLGHKENSELNKIYQENDVFILPSKSEPWGLVVEEALYNGLPVILSNKVGCSSEVIKNNIHGYIYDVESSESLIEKIKNIIDIKNYNKIKKEVDKINFEKKIQDQINQYLLLNL